ncbi:MAG: hypothetical protein ACRD0Y_12245 [Terriglobales bacterium]
MAPDAAQALVELAGEEVILAFFGGHGLLKTALAFLLLLLKLLLGMIERGPARAAIGGSMVQHHASFSVDAEAGAAVGANDFKHVGHCPL